MGGCRLPRCIWTSASCAATPVDEPPHPRDGGRGSGGGGGRESDESACERSVNRWSISASTISVICTAELTHPNNLSNFHLSSSISSSSGSSCVSRVRGLSAITSRIRSRSMQDLNASESSSGCGISHDQSSVEGSWDTARCFPFALAEGGLNEASRLSSSARELTWYA